MIHIGMDLHHKMAYLRAITEEGELLPGRKLHFSNMSAFWKYFDDFEGQSCRVVLEAVSNSRWMHRLLSQRGNITPAVVTPHKVKIIAQTVAKTDKIDAGKLAWLSSINMLPEAWMPDERIEQLRELVRHRHKQVQQRTRAKNEVNGVLIRRGLQRPYDNIFGTYGRKWLATLELPTAMRLQLDAWLEDVDLAEKRIASLDGRIRRILQSDEQWTKDAVLLDSIPGVALVTTATILAELGDYRRFRRRAEVAAYAGLVPSSKRSANTSRYGRISKRGPAELRRVLIQVARGVAKRVPRYGIIYERLKREKNGNIAKTAVARRLLEDAWTILMKREPFRLSDRADC